MKIAKPRLPAIVAGIGLAVLAATGCRRAGLGPASRSAPRPRDGITATFSIVAVDPETGECGAAVARDFAKPVGIQCSRLNLEDSAGWIA